MYNLGNCDQIPLYLKKRKIIKQENRNILPSIILSPNKLKKAPRRRLISTAVLYVNTEILIILHYIYSVVAATRPPVALQYCPHENVLALSKVPTQYPLPGTSPLAMKVISPVAPTNPCPTT